MSKATKKIKKKYLLFYTLSVLCTLLPLFVYIVIGLIQGTIGEKVTLGLTLILCIMFVAINIVFKRRIRCTIWVLMLGIYVCVDNMIPLLVLVAISTIIDEFLLEPLAKKYKTQLVVNKEIDKRENDNGRETT